MSGPGIRIGPISFSRFPEMKKCSTSLPPLICAPYRLRLPDLIGDTAGSRNMCEFVTLSILHVPSAIVVLKQRAICGVLLPVVMWPHSAHVNGEGLWSCTEPCSAV